MAPTLVYTDGACAGNPGPGGWAWAVASSIGSGGRWASGADPATTNQRMELTAALEAMRSLDGEVEVRSDSTYVVNCINERWYEGWMKRGWVNSKKEPVANQDLWRPFIELYLSRRDELTYSWVKGHSGDRMNDLVDRLAVAACSTQQAGTGDRTPTLEEAGPADLPRGRTAAPKAPTAAPGGGPVGVGGATLPPGHAVLVSGLRPPGLGGYEPNLVQEVVKATLVERLTWLAEATDDLYVVTGLQLGAEQLGAEAAVEAGVPFAAVLAFEGVESRWPDASRVRFHQLMARARPVVVLEKKAPADGAGFARAMGRMDSWLDKHLAEAIVVWDGEDAAVGRRVRALESALGADAVTVVTP